MARHRRKRSNPALSVPHRPGQHSRSTYRQLYRQSRPGPHQRPVRIRQRRARQRIRRDRIRHAQGLVLRPHWVRACHPDPIGTPGLFWWRWA